MKMEIAVNSYDPEAGVRLEWGDDCSLLVTIDHESVLLQANQNGLIEFAKHLLTLAQETVPEWYHVHYDEWNMLQQGSIPLIVKKSEK